MTPHISAASGLVRTSRRSRRVIAVAAALGLSVLLGIADPASASLLGAEVSYESLFPNTQSVLNNLGTETVTPLTSFADPQNGLTSFFIGNQIVVENTSPLAFATASFNGPQFTLSTGGITGATVAATSSPDFQGVLSSTGNSVQANFSALTPALGSTMTIQLTAGGPLAGQQVGYHYLLPTTGSVQENLGTRTLMHGTYFVDAADGITIVVGPKTITIINDEPLAFAAGTFNGPDLVFTGTTILDATIDPVSAADFQGTLSFTPDSIEVNFAGLAPQTGHALVIDVDSLPEPASLSLLGVAVAGLAWLRRRDAVEVAGVPVKSHSGTR
jgi:hypothetical protein